MRPRYSRYIGLSSPTCAKSDDDSRKIPRVRGVTRPEEFRLDFPQVLHMWTLRGATFKGEFKYILIHRVGKQESPDQAAEYSRQLGYSTELSTSVLHRHSGLVSPLSTELSTARVAGRIG